jgi:hypothetical protein
MPDALSRKIDEAISLLGLEDINTPSEYNINDATSYYDTAIPGTPVAPEFPTAPDTKQKPTVAAVSPVQPTAPVAAPVVNTSTSTSHPTLESLFTIVEGPHNFTKAVDFLGNIAEAESMKGAQTYNPKSSASGIFHFLIGNGGGYTAEGKRTTLGQYDKSGNLRLSSFEMAKKRLRTIISNPDIKSKIQWDKPLQQDLAKILSATEPNKLSPQQQAVLAYAHLKLTSSDFDQYLQGRKDPADVYGKVWVTYKTKDSLNAIKRNWNRAVVTNNMKKGGIQGQFSYFDLIQKQHPIPLLAQEKEQDQTTEIYSTGGILTKQEQPLLSRINSKRILI